MFYSGATREEVKRLRVSAEGQGWTGCWWTIKPRIQKFKSPPLPSAVLYFLLLLHCWPHISRPHLVSKPYFSHLCLLLSHSSGAMRCADVPVNEVSSADGFWAPDLLEQVDPRRQRWVNAATVTVVPESCQSYLMTPEGNSKHRVLCQNRARGR